MATQKTPITIKFTNPKLGKIGSHLTALVPSYTSSAESSEKAPPRKRSFHEDQFSLPAPEFLAE